MVVELLNVRTHLSTLAAVSLLPCLWGYIAGSSCIAASIPDYRSASVKELKWLLNDAQQVIALHVWLTFGWS